jgi:hypothetical protein
MLPYREFHKASTLQGRARRMRTNKGRMLHMCQVRGAPLLERVISQSLEIEIFVKYQSIDHDQVLKGTTDVLYMS